MDAKETAVGLLVETIFNEVDLKDPILKLAISQAIALEKEQMKECAIKVLDSEKEVLRNYIRDQFEKYYNETYGK